MNTSQNNNGSGSHDEVQLNAILKQVEDSLTRLKLVKDGDLRKAESAKIQCLLARAEDLKKTRSRSATPISSCRAGTPNRLSITYATPQSTRQSSKAEQIIVLKSSIVNGIKFPPWQASPKSTDFEPDSDGSLFTDQTVFTLSRTQEESLAGWKRPREALPPPSKQLGSGTMVPVSMYIGTDVDLVQDAATDCSVVASLCTALARVQRGHAPLLTNVFFPHDPDSGRPVMSKNGRYIARFYFNGAWRRVEIDDRLPVSKTARIIHCIDRNNPSILWPALFEKLYLKVRGGYDFPGSNSSTDLWVLLGWIPEQVFLHSETMSLLDMWPSIWQAHQLGDVMITLGTGKLSARAERDIGLASEHDYAVLDLREEQGQKLMLVKNPWCQGATWRGTRRRASSAVPATGLLVAEDAVASPRDLLNSKSQLSPGTFWMDSHSVEQYFESVYLNWNPGIFKHRQDIHFSWDLGSASKSSTLVNNPQFSFSIARGSWAWLVLSRHFSKEGESASAQRETSAGFMSLSMYDACGARVVLKDGAIDRTPFVDNFNALLKVSDLVAGRRYTVVVDQDELPGVQHNFTLSVFSLGDMYLEKAPSKFACSNAINGEWDEDTAGGSSSSPTFAQNPQFSIDVLRPTAMSILLDTTNKSVPVNVKMLISNGKRVYRIRSRDVAADSAKYRPGCALALARLIDPGVYTIVCSTFEAGQTGDFTLRIDSDDPVQLRKLPNDGAGRVRTVMSEANFLQDQRAMALLLIPQRLTKFIAVINYLGTEGQPIPASRSMIRASITQGNDTEHKIISTTSESEYEDSSVGIRTHEIDLSPSMTRTTDLFLILERDFSARSQDDETFSVSFLTESRDAVQTGDWRHWEV